MANHLFTRCVYSRFVIRTGARTAGFEELGVDVRWVWEKQMRGKGLLAKNKNLTYLSANWRIFMYGLIAGGFGSMSTPESASAAKRRPPPPPQEEKKNPNVSGVQAKVLASKKRKEAMKETVSKMREKGKPVQ